MAASIHRPVLTGRRWSAQEVREFAQIARELAHDDQLPLEPAQAHDLAQTVLRALPHVAEGALGPAATAFLAAPAQPGGEPAGRELPALRAATGVGIEELAAGPYADPQRVEPLAQLLLSGGAPQRRPRRDGGHAEQQLRPRPPGPTQGP
jgi:hypothetical protein